jgi:hypothetical protein
MIIFVRREVLPDKEVLKQQFTFLTSEDLDDIYRWMQEKRELCVQHGNNSTNCAIQQVYKYFGVIITNDHPSEFRTWAYEYDSTLFEEEYASERKILIIYESYHRNCITN